MSKDEKYILTQININNELYAILSVDYVKLMLLVLAAALVLFLASCFEDLIIDGAVS